MEELNPTNYYLKFVLKDKADSLVYHVTKEEQERVSHSIINNNTHRIFGSIIEFETLSGTIVNVNLKYVALCQSLWNAGRLEPEEESPYELVLIIDGISEPLNYDDAHVEELDLIASILQGVEPDEDAFVGFTNDDGERDFVNINNIMLMESVEYRTIYEEEMETSQQVMASSHDPRIKLRAKVEKSKTIPKAKGCESSK